MSGSRLVGVLSVYATTPEAFSDDHRRLIEVIARQVSASILQATESDSTRRQPTANQYGVPSRERVERFIAAELDLTSTQTNLSIIHITVDPRGGLESSSGRTLVQSQSSMVAAIRKALRGADVLFSYSESEFVVVLTQTDLSAASAVANRIREILVEAGRDTSDSLHPLLGVASAPEDGRTLEDLVSVAAKRPLLRTAKSTSWPRAIH